MLRFCKFLSSIILSSQAINRFLKKIKQLEKFALDRDCYIKEPFKNRELLLEKKLTTVEPTRFP